MRARPLVRAAGLRVRGATARTGQIDRGGWKSGSGAARFRGLTVAGSLKHEPATAGQSAGPYGVPAYYVALITAKPRSDVENQLGSSSLVDTAAELRSTQTGAVLAKVTPPKPYVSFTGVTAAADDRTFVVSAQGPVHSFGMPPFPAQRFFLLRIDQASQAGARMTLTALPAGYVPPDHGIHDMALSPDGNPASRGHRQRPAVRRPAATCSTWPRGPNGPGASRTCASCVPGSGGMVYGRREHRRAVLDRGQPGRRVHLG